MEQTLFICKEVAVYRIPPRAGRGHISGQWKTEDKLFAPRCRVVAVDKVLEIRLEDPSNGEIFGVCPVPPGMKDIAVEGAVDSSRNFVLRIVDPATQRHAFLGLSFADRTNAFDFNVALTDFDRHLQRAEEISKISAAADPAAAAQGSLPEAAALYTKQDLSLREGESMRVEVKRKPTAEGGGGGFLSRLGGAQQPQQAGASGAGVALKLPTFLPPPAAPASPPPRAVPASSAAVPPVEATAGAFAQLSFRNAAEASGAQHQQASGTPAPPAIVTVASSEESWATF